MRKIRIFEHISLDGVIELGRSSQEAKTIIPKIKTEILIDKRHGC